MYDRRGLVLAVLLIAPLLSAGGCYPASGPAPGDTAEQERFWTTESVAARTEALRKLHPDVPASQANFVWLPLGDQALAFGAACEKRGVIVRSFAGDGVRITIGKPEENDALLAAAEAAL